MTTPPARRGRGAARRAGRALAAFVASVVAGATLVAAQAGAANACPLEIVGFWKAQPTKEHEPVRLLRFSSDGWATVLEGSAQSPAEDFEAVADVRYELVEEGLRFDVRRGNEVLPPGIVLWSIAGHGDDTLAVVDPDGDGEESRWVRVQTRRYFITFAAREGNAEAGAPAAFVMWTEIDGRGSRLEGIGVFHEGDAAGESRARFGPIPPALARAFATESGRASDVMLRLELNEAEYRRTREIFTAWNVLLSAGLLADEDPHAQALHVIAAAAQAVNRCGARVRAPEPEHAGAEAADAAAPRRGAIEAVRFLRDTNGRLHVPDRAFPFAWRPPPVGD